MQDKELVYTVWMRMPDPEHSNLFIGVMDKIINAGIKALELTGTVRLEDSTLHEIQDL